MGREGRRGAGEKRVKHHSISVPRTDQVKTAVEYAEKAPVALNEGKPAALVMKLLPSSINFRAKEVENILEYQAA